MSHRKPYNDRAGYVASKLHHPAGPRSWAVIYVAAEAGIDADDKYVTVCEAHGQMASSRTLPLARSAMKAPWNFCGECEAAVPVAAARRAEVAATFAKPALDVSKDAEPARDDVANALQMLTLGATVRVEGADVALDADTFKSVTRLLQSALAKLPVQS